MIEMGKGARVRGGGRRARPSDPLGAAVTASNAMAGVGRPDGTARARMGRLWGRDKTGPFAWVGRPRHRATGGLVGHEEGDLNTV